MQISYNNKEVGAAWSFCRAAIYTHRLFIAPRAYSLVLLLCMGVSRSDCYYEITAGYTKRETSDRYKYLTQSKAARRRDKNLV